jgi:hypothetical protein
MSNKSPKRDKPKRISKRQAKEESSRFATISTIIGLVVGVVGLAGLITLRPQITVSPSDALDHSQPFTVPFHITNASYYAIDEVTPTFYIHRLLVGGADVGKNLVKYPAQNLDHGETGTVVFQFLQVGAFPQDADIVVVIDYHIAWLPFWHPRQYFRFVGQYAENWQWLAEPIGAVRQETDAAFEHDRQTQEMFKSHFPDYPKSH